jgi:hypothetical protein
VEGRVWSENRSGGIVGGQGGTGTGFSMSISVFLLVQQCYLLIFIYLLLFSEGQTGEIWEPYKCTALSEIGQHWVEKYFSVFSHSNGFKREKTDDAFTHSVSLYPN